MNTHISGENIVHLVLHLYINGQKQCGFQTNVILSLFWGMEAFWHYSFIANRQGKGGYPIDLELGGLSSYRQALIGDY